MRPNLIKDKHLEYLDTLRETAITNMFAAVPWVERAFPKLSHAEANEIHSYWMKTFGAPKR